ncbi:MAG: class I SAM-dependent methyltransferase [Elusimicrobiota bacterium]
MQETKCIVCNNIKTEKWAQKGDYLSVKCKKCGMVWIEPIPGEEELTKFYQGYYTARVKDKNSWEQRKTMYRIEASWLKNFITAGTILDIGCSDGSFLYQFKDRFECFGIELEKSAVLAAKKKGLNVICGSTESISKFGRKFGCVVLRGTIEHFPNPKKAIYDIIDYVASDGYIFITATPDVSSFCAEMYREKWNQFIPPEHIFYFDINTISILMKQFGFIKIAHHHFYLETPYANPEKDYKKIKEDIRIIYKNGRKKVKISPPFWGSMMTILFRREKNATRK